MKDILAVEKLPKATYMYWQKRFDRQNPDAELEAKIKAIRQSDKNFGYRRIWGKLRSEIRAAAKILCPQEPQIQFV